ncbi:diacylglycerol/lipid kinase family protein [Halobium palmae]|uniref:Diacylglycerol/lipid kinase family protein n=1 Tax=Halobium palmae TaxID=1776492 RepID=A0ABD5RUR1_9EURY
MKGSDSISGSAQGPDTSSDRWELILNPTSGDADHAEDVRSRAAARDYVVRETASEGDGISLAKEAAESGARSIAACGGDGTVHEVVYGLERAGVLDDVTVAVVPAGTGNSFAGNVGVTSIEHAFELLDAGDGRRIDVGMADDEPFPNSCIAGLTAKTSSETSSALKDRVGTFAYVLNGLQQTAEFEPMDVEIEIRGGPNVESTTWTGEALCLFVGNARRFVDGGGQADVEDGLLDVTIVEDMPTAEMLTEAAADQFFGRETEHVTHLRAERLDVASRDDREIEFSLDGEMSSHRQLSLRVRPRALEVVVGEAYRPDPENR